MLHQPKRKMRQIVGVIKDYVYSLEDEYSPVTV
jgi:hypothetical protein